MHVQEHKKLLRDLFLGAALRPEDMIRSAKAALGSLPILANALTTCGTKRVNVKHGHTLGATDGQTIYLMNLPIPGNRTDIDTFVLMLTLAYGLLHHEVGHINSTDFVAFRRSATGDPLTHRILGVIEDIREEHAHLRQYPAAKPYLDALNNAMFVTGHYADVGDGVPAVVALTGYLAYRCWCDYRGVGSIVLHAQQAEAVVRKLFSDRFIDRLDALLPRIRHLGDTTDAIELSQDIRNLVVAELEERKREKEEAEQANAQPDPSATPQGADDDEDQDGDQADPSATPTGDAEEDADATEEDPQDDADHADEGTDGTDDAEPAAPSQESSEDGQGDELAQIIANLEAVNAGQDIDQALGDKSDAIAKALKELADELDKGSDGTVSLAQLTDQKDVTRPSGDIKLAQTPYDMGKATAVTGQLRMKLVSEMQALTQRDVSIHDRGRKISNRHLSRIGTGDGRIFRRQSEVVEVDTAVVLVTDVSGSMTSQNRIELACQALHATTVAMAGIDGVQCAATAFPGDHVLKPFGSGALKHLENFHLAAEGWSTPLDEGVLLAHRMLLGQKVGRRMMIVLTDGEPDSKAEAELAIVAAEVAGIEVFGLGIQTDAGRDLFRHWHSITDVAELPFVLLNLVRSRLLKAA
ncbi:VWA domain-containing protein [Rhodanobacter denitrificans]|uniref:VWA domain-containing protein n=1 Tax=Rhodanobacter denitrificans TaxID=666685 RepID=UPI001F467990|nr:VWA domain-containing protein [Rhodanobacter denitrificans]UJJ60443.1 VWA domain-containing protein [Rhodanobacter denitrificans]